MKSRLAHSAPAALLAFLTLAAAPRPARPQNPDSLLPAQSDALAHRILERAIVALGGPAFLQAHNSVCSGRMAQFQHSGALGSYMDFHEDWSAPDKDRVEYGNKGNIAVVYAGDRGWTLDRGGVSEIPAAQVADYRRRLETSVNTILRFRLHDPALTFRFGGSDVVELKQVDWVDITDRQGRLVRIAISKLSHLPVRSELITRDPTTGDREQRYTDYSSYQSIGGIQTPFQISTFINGRQLYQVFYRSCGYNADLSPDLFDRASLDAYFAKHHKH